MDKENSAEGVSIPALKAGDRREYSRLLEKYSDPVYRMALRMVNSEQDAEDVLQETFIKVFKNIEHFEERSSLSTWIYRIAMNEALMHLRKRRPEPVSIDEEPSNDEGDLEPREIVDWCCLPEKEFSTAETRAELDQAIKQLPQSLKSVFLLRDVEGLSIKETADALNLTETAVKTRLLRARLRLREILSEYFGEMRKQEVNHVRKS
jgi:RNA polymerase sigma-70 factor (ECF subfamily)